MIENLFGGGGGGGGGTVDTVVAGTGISVNSTDPANPIITNTSLNTDETAKVSSNDTTAGYLNGKLVAGTGVTLTENNNGGNETLTIVNSAPGDTQLTVTTADAENTTAKTNIISVTIPANTWLDGEQITIHLAHQLLSNGFNNTLTTFVSGTGITETSGLTSVPNSATILYGNQFFYFTRLGSGVLYPRLTNSNNYAMQQNHITTQVFHNAFDSSVDFTTNITLNIAVTNSTANANVYCRVLYARAIKTSAGQQ